MDKTSFLLIKCFSFEVAIRGLEWVANYEETRWFLVLKLERAPQNGLNKLLHVSNETVTGFGQPSLYTESLKPSLDGRSRKRQASRSKETSAAAASSTMGRAAPSIPNDMSSSFHLSIGWILGAPMEGLVERLNTLVIDYQAIKVDVHTVKAKIGNGITAISIATKIDNLNKIIETCSIFPRIASFDDTKNGSRRSSFGKTSVYIKIPASSSSTSTCHYTYPSMSLLPQYRQGEEKGYTGEAGDMKKSIFTFPLQSSLQIVQKPT